MDMTANHLSIYLERIYTFLISNAKSKAFSCLTMAMEDVMVNIAEDADYLKNGMLDDDCKSQAAKIVTELEEKKQIYTLTYAFEIDEYSKKVLVYKKTPVPSRLKQLRKPKAITTNASVSTTEVTTNTVMSSFITSSLNATLKFAKDDSRLVLQYPDMSTEQAEFVKHMITQCMTASNGKDTGPCSKGLFDPLAEALKIFSLKYEFKLNDGVPTSVDMKRLVFEKIPKQSKNKIEKDLDSNSSTTSSEGSNKLKHIQKLIKYVPEVFRTQAFLVIKDFIGDNTESLIFENVSLKEEQFLTNWKIFLKPETATYFPQEVQKILGEIKEQIGLACGKFIVRTTMEKISRTQRSVYLEKKWTYKPEGTNSLPEQKVNKKIAEVNNNIPLNSMPTAKVNTLTMKLNEPQANSKSAEKVNTQNSLEKMDPMFLKHKEGSKEVNNNQLNTISKEKVNTENGKDSNEEDFIAIRKDIGSPIKPPNPKTRSLLNNISKIDGRFARYAITSLIDFFSGQEETLLFRDLEREELEFLLRWEEVIKRIEVVRMFSIPGQMALDELRTMVDLYAGKFKIESKTASPTNSTLTFVKQYVKKKQQNSALELEDEPTSNSNFQKIKTPDFIQDIPQSWIKNTLNQLKEFLEDSAQGSLLLPAITPSQKDFLIKWRMMTKKEVMGTFPEDVQRILKEIGETVGQNDRFVVSLKVGKLTKNGTRDASFIKSPCYPPLPSQKEVSNTSDTKPEKSKPKTNSIKTDIPSLSRRMRELENKNAEQNRGENKKNSVSDTMPEKSQPKTNENKTDIPSQSRRMRELGNNAELNRVGNKDETPLNPRDKSDVPQSIPKASSATSLPGTIPKAASVTSLPGKPRDDVSARPKSASTAKAKLIEALSQPLVSERGLKMMRNMGWEGGALGARGEGIMEPLALNLDLGKRAGLGCVKPTPKQQKIREVTSILPLIITRRITPNSPPINVMKSYILSAIEELVMTAKTDTNALELVTPANYSKKAWKFVRLILTSVNSRTTNIDLPDSPILPRIMECMEKTDFIITACYGVSGKTILFVLSKDIYHPPEHEKKYWFDIINVENSPKSHKTMGAMNEECIIVDDNAFKEYVMAQILGFCKTPVDKEKNPAPKKVSQEIKLRGIMAHKQMSYIQDVIKRLNSRTRASSDKMKGVFDEIVATMRGFDLHVDFPGANGAGDIPIYKCIRLHKIFYAHHVISPYYEKSISDTSDMLSVHSMISINKLLQKTTTTKDTTNNMFTKYYTDSEKSKDESKEKERTSDTKKDENATLDNQNTAIDSQNEPIASQITSIDGKNGQENFQDDKTKDECKENRTINYVFVEKCLLDDEGPSSGLNSSASNERPAVGSQNPTIDSQSALMASQNAAVTCQSGQVLPIISQNAPMSNQNAATTSQSSQILPTTSQNAATTSQVLPMISPNVAMTSQNADTTSQIAPMTSQNAATTSQSSQILPMISQNAPMTSQNAAMTSQIAPMPNQNAATTSQSSQILPTTSQNAVRTCQNLLTEDDTDIFGDCLCCVHNDRTPDVKLAKAKEIIIETNATVKTTTTEPVKTEEQEKERDSHRQDSESNKEGAQIVDGKAVKTRVQYFNINGLKSIIDGCISRIECTQDVKKTLTELKDSIFLQICEKKLERPKGSLDQKITDIVLGKRSCSSPNKPYRQYKKFKNTETVKRISITPKNYPQSEITNEMAGEIQKSILNSIDYTKELPLLECHGIQNGALVYTCHTEQTINFIDSLTQSLHLQISVEESEKTYHKLSVRIFSFIDESIDKILDRLEMYNKNVFTKDWKVLSLEKVSNSLVIHLEIDDSSFEFLVKENFTLYAGIDQAKFSIVWD